MAMRHFSRRGVRLSLIERRTIEAGFLASRDAGRSPQTVRAKASLRKERGWSQERLALESGIARSYLGGVERGQRNIALLNICRLAASLGRSPADLMDFKGG
ncbi:MAG: hypothetical protein AMXMBFR59_16730 [Rhodanobacteraceae bacterium]